MNTTRQHAKRGLVLGLGLLLVAPAVAWAQRGGPVVGPPQTNGVTGNQPGSANQPFGGPPQTNGVTNTQPGSATQTINPLTGFPTTGTPTFNPLTGAPTTGTPTFNPLTGAPTTGAQTTNTLTGFPTTGTGAINPVTGFPTTGTPIFNPLTGAFTTGGQTTNTLTGFPNQAFQPQGGFQTVFPGTPTTSGMGTTMNFNTTPGVGGTFNTANGISPTGLPTSGSNLFNFSSTNLPTNLGGGFGPTGFGQLPTNGAPTPIVPSQNGLTTVRNNHFANGGLPFGTFGNTTGVQTGSPFTTGSQSVTSGFGALRRSCGSECQPMHSCSSRARWSTSPAACASS